MIQRKPLVELINGYLIFYEPISFPVDIAYYSNFCIFFILIFTARNYAKAWYFLSAGVCLSIRLSVTFVYCIQTANDIVKLFLLIVLVFFEPKSQNSLYSEYLYHYNIFFK